MGFIQKEVKKDEKKYTEPKSEYALETYLRSTCTNLIKG